MKEYAPIGILGGMGPIATLEFIQTVYNECLPVEKDSEFPRLIVDFNTQIPSSTRC